MQTLHIQLVEVEEHIVELRYFFAQTSQYEPQILNLAAIQALLKQAKRDYYIGQQPDLAAIGQQLFFWLDGDGRWLSRAIANCPSEGLILALTTSARLAHLPWEALHDGTDFLVRRVNPVVVPVRWSDRPTPAKPIQARPLQVLFMATSPEEVEAVLDFEREEARILENTQELPLVLRVEESGCITQLDKLWSRYREPFDVFHLTGHAGIPIAPPYKPYFVTETETGDRYDATAEEIWNVFRYRPPQLVFLSGCRTGQAADDGAVPSLAEALIQQGATAVLGWGRPVTDVAATTAAAHLYGKLSGGYKLSEALASTYQHLWQQEVTDWHLLRLYVCGECLGALVEPLGDYIWQPPEPADELFLDPLTQLVRVATRLEFVGRRWILQHCLKALRSPNNLGVLLYGLGGVGKSTVAARLLERMAGYDDNRIFIHQQLDEAKLLTTLSQQCTSEQGLEILNGKLPLMQRLTKFLQQGLNYLEQRFVFVLDDFEANLESRADGVQVLKTGAIEVLMALLKAITNSKLPHRLIITCRYDFHLPELDRRLDRQPLAALQGADLRKKCDRLTSFNAQSEIDPALQKRAKNTADGNPRLLEWLDKILRDEQLDRVKIIEQMEGKAAQFLADILAEELLKQQPEALRKMLGWSLVYELPVPKTAIAAICSSIPNLDYHINRATSLGLLEVSNTQAEPHYRVPRILEPLLQPFKSESQELYSTAAQFLGRTWAKAAFLKLKREEVGLETEAQLLEIHRLAQRGQEGDIAFWTGHHLAVMWRKQARFQDTVGMCRSILKINNYYRTLHTLALAEEKLGEMDNCIQHYQEALNSCPIEDDIEKADIIHNFAYFLINWGHLDQALILNQQLYHLGEGSNNLAVKASALHQSADIKTRQRQVELGLEDYQQALELRLQINDDKGVAATLNNMALIYAEQGQINVWLNLFQKILEPFERSGEMGEMTGIFSNMAVMLLKQKRYSQAIDILQPIFERYKHTGDVQLLAVILHNMATAYAEQEYFEDAIAHYEEVIKLTEGRYPDQQAEALYELGIVHLKQKKFPQALARLQEALKIWQQLSSPKVDKAKALIAVAIVEQSATG